MTGKAIYHSYLTSESAANETLLGLILDSKFDLFWLAQDRKLKKCSSVIDLKKKQTILTSVYGMFSNNMQIFVRPTLHFSDLIYDKLFNEIFKRNFSENFHDKIYQEFGLEPLTNQTLSQNRTRAITILLLKIF